MAKKSDNIKGNPYHDESTGQFTSENDVTASSLSIKIKAGLTPDKIKDLISNGAVTTPTQTAIPTVNQSGKLINDDGTLIPAKNAQEAIEQGAQILGEKGVVYYDSSTNIENIRSFNEALNDVHRDFANCFETGALIGYGTLNTDKMFFDKLQAAKDIAKKVEEKLRKNSSVFINAYGQNMFDGIVKNLLGNINYNLKALFGKMRMSNIDGKTRFLSKPNTSSPDSLGNTQAFLYSIKINNGNYRNAITKEQAEAAEKNPTHLHYGKGQAYDTATHEIGHFVSLHCFAYMDKNDYIKMRSLFRTNNAGAVDTIGNLKNNREISLYAAQDAYEHIAEAFADVYSNGTNAQLHNKRIVKFFKEINDRIR